MPKLPYKTTTSSSFFLLYREHSTVGSLFAQARNDRAANPMESTKSAAQLAHSLHTHSKLSHIWRPHLVLCLAWLPSSSSMIYGDDGKWKGESEGKADPDNFFAISLFLLLSPFSFPSSLRRLLRCALFILFVASFWCFLVWSLCLLVAGSWFEFPQKKFYVFYWLAKRGISVCLLLSSFPSFMLAHYFLWLKQCVCVFTHYS